jgi:hypothetical protein
VQRPPAHSVKGRISPDLDSPDESISFAKIFENDNAVDFVISMQIALLKIGRR